MANDVQLPSGATMVSDDVTLPAGASLVQDEAKSSPVADYVGNFASGLNPFPALKKYFWDLPQQHQAEVANELQQGHYMNAVKAAIAGGMPPQVDMAKDIGAAQLQHAKAAVQSYKSGDYSEAAGHAMAAGLPVLGPAAAQVGQQIGSGDVAGGLGSATALLLPFGAGEAASAIAPRLAPGAAEGLQASAEKNWYDALNPTKEKMKALAKDKVAPGLAERQVTASSIPDLREQAQAQMANYGAKIDDIFDQQAQQGKTMPATNLLKAMQDAHDEELVGGISFNEPYTNALSSMMDKVKQLEGKYGGQIPLEELRKLRQSLDNQVARSKGGFALPPDAGSQVDAMRVLPNAIRGEFAQNIPDLADANKQFSFWKNVDDVAGSTNLRRVGQRAPLTQRFAEAGGAIVGAPLGPKGAIAGAKIGGMLAKLQNTVWFQSLSAANKAKAVDLINQGNAIDALRLAGTAGTGNAAANLSQRSELPALTPGQ